MLKKTLCVLALTGISSTALASGYQISEYSVTGLGRSFAGSGVVGDDYSALGYNPAGMQLNKTSGVQAGATLITLFADYKNLEAPYEKGDSLIARVLPNFFAQYKLNEKATFGAGIYTPYGLAIDYDNGWFGEDHGGLSELKAINFSVGGSYQLHKTIAVGASVNAQYAEARLTSTGVIPSTPFAYAKDLNGDDPSLGYTLGAVFTPIETVRLGVSYRSKVEHKLKGDVKLSASGIPVPPVSAAFNRKYDVSAKITTPELVTLSAAFDATKDLTLSATARWTRWSQFKNLNIIAEETMPSGPAGSSISSTHENWKDAWFYSIGADYKMNENWTLRLGGAYDETVIKSSAYRTVRIPDGRRFFASVGLSYLKENWQFDAGYMHVWMKSGTANGKENGAQPVNVRYNDAGSDMFGLGLQYSF